MNIPGLGALSNTIVSLTRELYSIHHTLQGIHYTAKEYLTRIRPPKEVWVLYHYHKHGHDLFAFLAEELAWKHATAIVNEDRENWDCVDEELSDREAARDWYSQTGGIEFFEVNLLRVVEA